MKKDDTWYFKHRESELNRVKKWKIDNKERFTDYCKEYTKTIKGRYISYKNSAKQTGRIFELTQEDFSKYWNKECFYCGDIVNGIGLDRVDNSIGYLKENIVSCCETCNRMKLTTDMNDFLSRCRKITDNTKTIL